MPIEKVLVVGGGLAGMTLATALARKGVRAEIAPTRADRDVRRDDVIPPETASYCRKC
jgi:2-polyprenyl-6-methoxyphenol hydroxylase-like FAD-dependent oxidoreductase